MKAFFSLISLIFCLTVGAQVDTVLSARDCDREHLKFVFKNFKVTGENCARQDILFLQSRRIDTDERLYRITSDRSHQHYVNHLLDIYISMALDCVMHQDSFDILIIIEVEGCGFEDGEIDEFKILHKINTELVMEIDSSLPTVCLSRGYPIEELPFYNGLAPFPIRYKIPKVDIN